MLEIKLEIHFEEQVIESDIMLKNSKNYSKKKKPNPNHLKGVNLDIQIVSFKKIIGTKCGNLENIFNPILMKKKEKQKSTMMNKKLMKVVICSRFRKKDGNEKENSFKNFIKKKVVTCL